MLGDGGGAATQRDSFFRPIIFYNYRVINGSRKKTN